jgi:hypothetical protein
MTIYPLTEHEKRRVDDCVVDFFSRIPRRQREQIKAGARLAGVSTEIEIDLSDPDVVEVRWCDATAFFVPRQALAGDEPLEDAGELPPVPDYPPDASGSTPSPAD